MAIPRTDDCPRCCIDQTGTGTKILAVATSLAIHFLLGSLYNYPEDFNVRFNYPNLGSSLFVLSIALYCVSRSLHPKFLCIKSGVAQSVYKILTVTLFTNVLLVAIWQQIVNLTVEIALIVHDILIYFNQPHASWLKYLPCYLSHLIGFQILAWIVSNMYCTARARAACREGRDKGAGPQERKEEGRRRRAYEEEEGGYHGDGGSMSSGDWSYRNQQDW
ncbi:hypothetical protein M8J76_014948 [Diaphorina citri]|nr:hypothetical protein M8J75_015026 [Diaphorina citri]KAI5737594.1 hypothetical protein M8J76_014948 [Diaphorina citri]KAI5755966.1 hypothetical protein M8J77_021026 [Diaphorina citri]